MQIGNRRRETMTRDVAGQVLSTLESDAMPRRLVAADFKQFDDEHSIPITE